MSKKQSQNVKVCARFRPINERERNEKVPFTLDIKYTGGTRVEITSNSAAIPQDLKFDFDHVFDPSTTQLNFYELSCKPVVDDVLKGYNGTIFAYGQTGSGKSYSMMGSLKDENLYGLIPRASRQIFDLIHNTPEEEGAEFKVSCSYLEIYNESIQDLFDTSKKNLQIRESPTAGIYVDQLTEEFVGNEHDIYELIEIGANNRVVAITQMNATSSRSHSVFTIRVNCTTNDGTTRNGKLNLVDLAGSEKVGKTGATGQTLEEAKKINQSLSSLGNCINALVERKPHVPYRDSKLTRVLQESLGGNSKTTMICACSPHQFNIEETISTLKFGQRAKTIKLNVKINAVKSAKELMILVEKLQDQITQLKAKNKNLEKQIEYLKQGKPIPEALLKEAATGVYSEISDSISSSDSVDSPSSSDRLSDPANPQQSEFDEKAYFELQFQLDQLNAKFKDEKTQLEEDLNAALDENDQLVKKIKDLMAEKQIYEEEMEDLLDENEKLVAQHKERQNVDNFSKRQWDLEKSQMGKEIEELVKEVENLEAQLKRSKSSEADRGDSIASKLVDLNDPTVIDELAKKISEPIARGKVMAEIDRLRNDNKLQLELLEQLQRKTFKLESDLNDMAHESSSTAIDLRTDLTATKRDQQKTKEEVSKSKDETRRVEKDKKSYEKKYDDLKVEANKLLARLKITDKTEADLKKRIDQLRAEIVQKDDEITKLKLRLEKDGLDKTGKVSNIPAELESHLMDYYHNNMKEVRDQSDAREDKSADTIKTLRITIEEQGLKHQDSEKKLQKSIEDQTIILNETKAKAEKLSLEYNQTISQMDSAKKELTLVQESLKTEKSRYESSVQENVTEIKTFKEHIKSLQQDIENLTVVREELKQQLEGRTVSDSPNRVGRNWANEIFELRNSLKKVTEERNKLEAEANHSRKENASYRTKLKSAQQKLDLDRERITQLSNDLVTAQAHNNQKKNERDEFKRQKDQMQSKIEELEEALEAMQRTQAAERRRHGARIAVPVSRQSVLRRNQ